MAAFEIGDMVRVDVLKGFTKRGVPGISVMYTTWPEARFDGAKGQITKINPQGTHGVAQYLVNFRGIDQGRVAIPWQSQWFREEWLRLVQPAGKPDAAPQPVGAAAATGPGGRVQAGGAAQSVRGQTRPAGAPEEEAVDESAQIFVEAIGHLRGAVQVVGSRDCPPDYPIKANARSRHFFVKGHSSFDGIVPEFCFNSEENALASGFRPAPPNAE
ncbi:MAG TPA: hypothetical protein VFL82_16365 [Thermomicrobiales bacterium]|nr:hypothetical protein [Thermomicrobiales bacterium]